VARQGITEKCLEHAINHTCHPDFENRKFVYAGITRDPRRVGQEEVQCEICAVQCELFYFSVNKFISGVNPSNQWYESSEFGIELYIFWCEQYSFGVIT
jgi:hypothetical protein